jgi:hypothetical protein
LPNQTFLRENIHTQWQNQFVSYSISCFYVLVRTPCNFRNFFTQLYIFFSISGRMYSWFTRHVVFPLMALVPPIAVAFATNSLEFLVGITGSYAGAGIQYVVPALLVYSSRKATVKAIGVGVRNCHKSWFKSNLWVIFVNLWAIGCIVLVTWNHIAQAIKNNE